MTDNQQLGLRKVRRALLSVSDKTGIVELATALKKFDVEIISTGGTARTLREASIEVRDVSEVTGFPEMMDGRIKTLHPKIHGALLGVRDDPAHQAAMQEHGIEPIDLVVINLYPFQQTISRDNTRPEEAIEQIDIGGPAMIRSAAKNWESVGVITSVDDYQNFVEELGRHNGEVTRATRQRLAQRAFLCTMNYDAIISAYLDSLGEAFQHGIGTSVFHSKCVEDPPVNVEAPEFSLETFHGSLPGSAAWTISKLANLRYGENPHQIAALYQTSSRSGVANAELLSGKEMSFNNYVDADAAWQLVSDFDQLACAIIKHTNPAGVGVAESAEQAYRRALETDPVSAFGGIVTFNRKVDVAAARAVIEIFTEVICAPGYEAEALEVLKAKKNLRVLQVPTVSARQLVEYRQISGGMLLQTRDTHKLNREDLKVVSKRQPTAEEIEGVNLAGGRAKPEPRA